MLFAFGRRHRTRLLTMMMAVIAISYCNKAKSAAEQGPDRQPELPQQRSPDQTQTQTPSDQTQQKPRAQANGYATRYWDCCKPHCGWPGNVSGGMNPVGTCDINNHSHGRHYLHQSSCGGGDGFTCFGMAPWAKSDTLSYGFAAVPANGAVCGKCYEIQFNGEGHYGEDKGARKLVNKRMIVQATNIGHDVNGGQFDLLIPGGGVGAFNACSRQWNVADSELGAQYGGILSACKQKHGYNAELETYKSCVREKCNTLFGTAGRSDLLRGCMWFVDWFEVADNPNLQYTEVSCPRELDEVSGKN